MLLIAQENQEVIDRLVEILRGNPTITTIFIALLILYFQKDNLGAIWGWIKNYIPSLPSSSKNDTITDSIIAIRKASCTFRKGPRETIADACDIIEESRKEQERLEQSQNEPTE